MKNKLRFTGPINLAESDLPDEVITIMTKDLPDTNYVGVVEEIPDFGKGNEMNETSMIIGLTAAGELFLSDGNYSVALPPTVAGLRYIMSILVGRQMNQKKLGEAGAPLQSSIDALVKEYQVNLPTKIKAIEANEINSIKVELDL